MSKMGDTRDGEAIELAEDPAGPNAQCLLPVAGMFRHLPSAVDTPPITSFQVTRSILFSLQHSDNFSSQELHLKDSNHG